MRRVSSRNKEALQGLVISKMLFDSTSKYVSTTEVANALGIGVSTVKRWVDDGVLPAHKTAGGHRKLLMADVLELARRGDFPLASLPELAKHRRGKECLVYADLAKELLRSLLAGNSEQVRLLVIGSYNRGMSIEDLADHMIAPAMKNIGHAWEAGRIDVMEEHRASQICAAALYELKATLELRVSKNRPQAVGGAAENDKAVLPTLLAQMVLIDAGWDAVNLGPNTPFRSLLKAIAELRPKLLWLSVCHPMTKDEEAEFVSGYRELYRQAEKAGVAVAIGGNALVENFRSRIPYTTYGDRLSHLVAFARTLNPKPTQPRRGRPRSE
jgi:excisionase family DNA binding protein